MGEVASDWQAACDFCHGCGTTSRALFWVLARSMGKSTNPSKPRLILCDECRALRHNKSELLAVSDGSGTTKSVTEPQPR